MDAEATVLTIAIKVLHQLVAWNAGRPKTMARMTPASPTLHNVVAQ